MSEIPLAFLIANLGAGIAVLAVLTLRKPVRLAFGAPLAYALWLLVPLAAVASLLPPRTVEIIQPSAELIGVSVPASAAPDGVVPALPAERSMSEASMPAAGQQTPPPGMRPVRPIPWFDPWTLAVVLWFVGAVTALMRQLRNQVRFMTDASNGLAGPAVVGLVRPRIVMPSDFEEKFDERERQIILAHEAIHLERGDAQINALVALLSCVCWFNPLIHIAAYFMRLDQELACDAAIRDRHPRSRGIYAATLLKTHLASRPLPAGCYWPARSEHPLMERVAMLDRAIPGKRARRAGMGALVMLAAGSGLAAWAAKPPVMRYTKAIASPAAVSPLWTALRPSEQPHDMMQRTAPQAPPPPAVTARIANDPVNPRGKADQALTAAPQTSEQPRGSNASAASNDDIILTGKVRKAETDGVITELLVEEVSRSPASPASQRRGTLWTVYLVELPEVSLATTTSDGRQWVYRRWTGETIAVAGKPPGLGPAAVSIARECERDCELVTNDAATIDAT